MTSIRKIKRHYTRVFKTAGRLRVYSYRMSDCIERFKDCFPGFSNEPDVSRPVIAEDIRDDVKFTTVSFKRIDKEDIKKRAVYSEINFCNSIIGSAIEHRKVLSGKYSIMPPDSLSSVGNLPENTTTTLDYRVRVYGELFHNGGFFLFINDQLHIYWYGND